MAMDRICCGNLGEDAQMLPSHGFILTPRDVAALLSLNLDHPPNRCIYEVADHRLIYATESPKIDISITPIIDRSACL
ncbi:hypothetical protein ACLOJK_031115 [Asimina triloba]